MESNYKYKIGIITSFIVTFMSQPGGVKADFGETVATLILFLLITLFTCAGIGWYHKRNQNDY